MGQLIQQGYDQEVTNGKILREAYTYRKGEYDHDERMRLLDLSEMTNDDTLPWKRLTFRADDYQRTVMSGQIVLRSLFDPELQAYKAAHEVLHTRCRAYLAPEAGRPSRPTPLLA